MACVQKFNQNFLYNQVIKQAKQKQCQQRQRQEMWQQQQTISKAKQQ